MATSPNIWPGIENGLMRSFAGWTPIPNGTARPAGIFANAWKTAIGLKPTSLPGWPAPPYIYGEDQRSIEHGSHIIEGLETGRVYRGHFNVMNEGCITNLPGECIVEVPVYVDRNGLSIPRVG